MVPRTVLVSTLHSTLVDDKNRYVPELLRDQLSPHISPFPYSLSQLPPSTTLQVPSGRRVTSRVSSLPEALESLNTLWSAEKFHVVSLRTCVGAVFRPFTS